MLCIDSDSGIHQVCIESQKQCQMTTDLLDPSKDLDLDRRPEEVIVSFWYCPLQNSMSITYTSLGGTVHGCDRRVIKVVYHQQPAFLLIQP